MGDSGWEESREEVSGKAEKARRREEDGPLFHADRVEKEDEGQLSQASEVKTRFELTPGKLSPRSSR